MQPTPPCVVVFSVACAVNDSVGQNRLTSRLGLSDHTIDLVLRIDQNLPDRWAPFFLRSEPINGGDKLWGPYKWPIINGFHWGEMGSL